MEDIFSDIIIDRMGDDTPYNYAAQASDNIVRLLHERFKSPTFRDKVSNLIESKTSIGFPESMHLQAEIEDLFIKAITDETY